VYQPVDRGARTLAAAALVADDRDMSTTAPQPAQAPASKGSRMWLWISALLALVCIGLLVWALSLNSDLNSTQSDLDKAQQDVANLQKTADQDQGSVGSGALVAAAKTAYDALVQQLGTTNDDVATNTQAVQDAQKAADAAQQAADAATSEIDKAQAQAEVAKNKANVAANCAKSYISAFGSLFDGTNIIDQAKAVASQVSSITDDCKAAFAAS
jgi:hypothetical protein